MLTVLQDLRYAVRRLRQTPGFAVVAIVTLALGIGANTAIFTLVHAVMQRKLPVAHPEQLYRLGDTEAGGVLSGVQGDWGMFSYDLYEQIRDHTSEFSSLASFEGNFTGIAARRHGSSAPARPLIGEYVSGNYFLTFGVTSYSGRLIVAEDDNSKASAVAVMSYHTWQQQFGSDPSVIGATFLLNTVPFTIVGIAPRGFYGDRLISSPPDFWLPISAQPLLDGSRNLVNRPDQHWLCVVGRLRHGADPSSVQAEVNTELQRWLAVQPNLSTYERSRFPEQHIAVVPAGGGVQAYARDSKALELLMALTGLILLMACANVANLLLARGASRRVETAIRTALGASRPRLVQLVVAQSVLLALLGGLLGLFVAYAGARMILAMYFRGARYVPVSAAPSWPVLVFALAVSLGTGVVFGVAPAWFSSHSNPAEALRGAGRGGHDRSSLPRQALVVLQVALSAVLLLTAGLLTESLRNLEDQSFGFLTESRYVAHISPLLAGYTPEALQELYRQLQVGLVELPGVVSSSYSLYSPMRGTSWGTGIHILGHSPEEHVGTRWDRVGPHYFETIGTPLLRGRVIDARDTANAPMVAVINETFAARYFPNEDPIGKRFGLGDFSHSADFEIIGVVADAKYQNAREPAQLMCFLPFLQGRPDAKMPWLNASQYAGDIELHVSGRPANMEANLRQMLAAINPNLVSGAVVSLGEQVNRNFNMEGLIARLCELFGGLALALACVGLYGVTANNVAGRTHEIGVRMALGAKRVDVLMLILRGVALQLLIGLAIGIPVVLAAGRWLASELYGVQSYDPLIIASAVAVLVVCAMLAGFVPARRAASIDPMCALRSS